MKRNLSLNPGLSRRVRIVERAIGSESNKPVFFEDNGPGSVVSFEKTARANGTVLTLTIDDLVVQEGLPRVDFIKMDIEGAELPALKGAVRTLQRFRPKLAICVYHNLMDLFEIPEFILSLGLGYRLFLRHFTIHSEETVLFARADMA
jgi:FkbM family methyltransferase